MPDPEGDRPRYYIAVSAGYDHALGLLNDGEFVGRGNNSFGQNGDAPPANCSCTAYPGGYAFRSISAGEHFTIGIIKSTNSAIDRTVLVWGRDLYGITTNPFGPTSGTTLKFTMAVAGGHNIILLDTNGNVYTWGDYYYNAGSGVTRTIGPNWQGMVPPGVSPPTNYAPGAYVSVGAGHVCAWGIRANGQVDFWGYNRQGQMDIVGGQTTYYAEVVGGYNHGSGLKRGTNTLASWQNNQNQNPHYNQSNQPPFPTPPTTASLYWGLSPGHSNYHVAAMYGCYADFDSSTASPALDINDYIAFNNEFQAALSLPDPQQIEHPCNCDGNTTGAILTTNDFICFNLAYSAGCYNYPQ